MGRWRGLTPDLSTTSWVISSDITLGEIKVRVSRGVRGSPALKAFAGHTETVKEGGWKIANSNAAGCGFASLSHGLGRKLPRLSPSIGLIVLDFDTETESLIRTLRTARPGFSRRGGGRVGRDAFLILSSVTLEESDAGGLMGTAVSDESHWRASRPRDSRSGGGRAGRDAFLILSPVASSEGDAGELTRVAVLGEGCQTEGAGLKFL
jgi:hypothetical protein